MSGCGCESRLYRSCGCSTPTNSRSVGTSFYVENSWNIPTCGNTAELDVPNVKTFLVGSYIWNPTYGRFLVTSFNSSNGKLTIENECLPENETSGSLVPANTYFNVDTPVLSAFADYDANPTGTGAMTYGTLVEDTEKYRSFYKEITLVLNFTGTVGGTPNGDLQFDLPFESTSEFNQYIPVTIYKNGSAAPVAGQVAIGAGQTVAVLRRADGTVNWPAGSGNGLIAEFKYQAE